MAAIFTAQLHPGRALGFLVLGASLHDVLTRLKAEPQRFPKLDLVYSPTRPVTEPVILTLPSNGIRLRFDGPEQRLRLIEVIDFTKNHITFKDRDLVRPPSASPVPGESSAGPTFRHIYHRLLGPTYGGEYIPPQDSKSKVGKYVLSYPGVAFTFPLAESAYSPNKDVVSLLSSSSTQLATSMAIFNGESWAQARERLWTGALPSIKTFAPLVKGSKDVCPDEISLIKIHGAGKLQLFRGWPPNSSNSSLWITLGQTTPQDLVAALGPPDAIYHKNDQRMYIHKSSRSRSNGADFRRDDLIDTDQSSAHTTDDSNDEAIEDDTLGSTTGECFYNYFYLGFDVLMSAPTPPSQTPPSLVGMAEAQEEEAPTIQSPDKLVATKLVLHNNIPGSYPFNRHRRCRWEIAYLPSYDNSKANSETPFGEIEEQLRTEWAQLYGPEADRRQRGMVLNRGWGDSPSSSVEFMGGWEESAGDRSALGPMGAGKTPSEASTTTLYGFPGLVFEVLRNGYVSALTVF